LSPEPFRPFAFLSGGHLQTLAGVLLRAPLRWRHPTEDVVVASDEEGVRLLVRASWQRASRRPALVLVHGLEGSDAAPYILATGALAYRAGWHVVRMNLRGCGDSLSLCPRLYNAGLTSDLIAVLRFAARRAPRLALAGFSLGGNLSLLTLARERSQLPDELQVAAAVCPPLDMSACADALERRSNRIYQRHFVRSLLSSYRKRQRLAPELYRAGRERGIRTLRRFDDVITAPYGGYRDAEDYYRSVSPGPRLPAIDRPTLVLAAGDDPFIPRASQTKFSGSEQVTIEIPSGGGHVGFVGRSRAPGRFWAAERLVSFFAGVFGAG
jgi:predicted alpha/beta-fold hydrolase